ncbi:MAG: superoxide dismutase [Nannocystaceae bacterium]
MSFTLPPLPFAQDALEPLMSARTLSFHHGKHHAGYVNKLNAAIEGTEHADKSLEEIIMSASGGLFNNAAQVWNHTFFWNCLKPNGGGAPTGDLADAINRDFGSFDAFKKQFAATAGGQFGSGWGWLVLDGGKLKIVSTGNADLPMKHGQTALFTVDVWEHAYYLDYQNARPDFINTILDKLANWDFVAKNLADANSAAS